MKSDLEYIQQCLSIAKISSQRGEVPIGAIIVNHENGEIVSAHNLKEILHDPTAHAEMLVIRAASEKWKRWRLTSCTLFVTLEPCPMCLYAMLQARIDRLVFGAYDFKGGALSLGYNFHLDERLNHSFAVTGGVLQHECSDILSKFFQERRSKINKI